MSEIREMFLCDCGMHGLVITDLKEAGCHEIYLALWQSKYLPEPKGFWERLRWCWQVLKTGQPWADEICLQPKDARKLGERLLELTKPWREKMEDIK